ETLNEEEGVEGAHGGAEVAQQSDPSLEAIGDRPQGFRSLGPDGAVIARVRLVQQWKALRMGFPVEIAAIDDEAADRGTVAADVLGARVDDDGSTMIEGAADDRGRGIVDDQGHAQLTPDARHLGDREDVQL